MGCLERRSSSTASRSRSSRAAGHDRQYPRREDAQAAAPPRPPRPQPLRGRHGEVHRLRAVRRGVPGRLHLRAGRRQPAGRTRSRRASATASSTRSTTCAASTATCASRRARPRRSPRRSCSSSPSPTGPTPSTPRTSCWSATTAGRKQLPWEDWRDGRRPAHLGLDAGDIARRAPPPTRARSSGRASSATACGARGRPVGRRDDAATGTKPLREVMEAHLRPRRRPVRAPGHAGPGVRTRSRRTSRAPADGARTRRAELKAAADARPRSAATIPDAAHLRRSSARRDHGRRARGGHRPQPGPRGADRSS